MQTVIGVESWEETKARRLKLAEKMDRGQRIVPTRRIFFDTAAAFLEQITPERQALLATVREAPATITDVARRLKRDRGEVKRDVKAMQSLGILRVRTRTDAEHGKIRVVSAPRRVKLQATL